MLKRLLYWATGWGLALSAACGVRPTPVLPSPVPIVSSTPPRADPALPTATVLAPSPTAARVTPTAIAEPTLAPSTLSQFRYTPSGLFLIVTERHLRLFDPATWQLQWAVTTTEGCCDAVALHGDLLAAVAAGGEVVYVWDTAAHAQRLRLAEDAGHFSTLAFSPDGQSLGTGEFGEIRLWDLATGQTLAGWSTGDPGVSGFPFTAGLTDLAFSLDGQTLFSANHWSGRVMAWNPRTGALQTALAYTNTLAFTFTPDARQLLVEYNADGFELHDLWTGRLTAVHDQIIGASGWHTFSADGRRVAVWGYNTDHGSTAAVWELSTETRLQEFSVGQGNPQWSRAALNTDGTVLALSDEHARQILFFDVASGQPIEAWVVD